jgi:hypothetical protein
MNSTGDEESRSDDGWFYRKHTEVRIGMDGSDLLQICGQGTVDLRAQGLTTLSMNEKLEQSINYQRWGRSTAVSV